LICTISTTSSRTTGFTKFRLNDICLLIMPSHPIPCCSLINCNANAGYAYILNRYSVMLLSSVGLMIANLSSFTNDCSKWSQWPCKVPATSCLHLRFALKYVRASIDFVLPAIARRFGHACND
jgi:hypothetical protein